MLKVEPASTPAHVGVSNPCLAWYSIPVQALRDSRELQVPIFLHLVFPSPETMKPYM